MTERQTIDRALDEAFRTILRASRDLEDPWWIFGTAALRLLGIQGFPIADVDLLTSERDARRLLSLRGGEAGGYDGISPWRSTVFAVLAGGPLRIEVMGSLHIRSESGWVPLQPRTRRAVSWESHILYVPSPADHARMYRELGRPKDEPKIAALEALASAEERT